MDHGSHAKFYRPLSGLAAFDCDGFWGSARKASLHRRLPSAARLAGSLHLIAMDPGVPLAKPRFTAGYLVYTTYSCADAEPTKGKFKCTLPTVMRS